MSGKTAGVLVTAAVTALCVNHFWYEIGDVFWPERKTIVATIELDVPLLCLSQQTQAVDIRWSGFGSLVGGVVVSDETLPNGKTTEFLTDPTMTDESSAYYQDTISFKPDTSFGLQIDADLTEGLRATAQLVTRGAPAAYSNWLKLWTCLCNISMRDWPHVAIRCCPRKIKSRQTFCLKKKLWI